MFSIFIGYGWFGSGSGSGLSSPFSSKTDNILDVQYTIYRNDGARYVGGEGFYASDSATVQSDAYFSMPEYDAIISEKNTANNLIVKLSFTVSISSFSNKTLSIKAITNNSTFSTAFSKIDDNYVLSSAIDFNYFIYTQQSSIVTTSSITTYNTVTEYFENNLASSKKNFFTFTDGVPTDKAGEIDTFLDASSIADGTTSIDVYMNITYDEILIKEIVGDSINSISSAQNNTISIVSDINFDLSLLDTV